MAYRRLLSDLRTAVRDNLDEATASFWTNAQLNRFLTRAADAVWMECRKLKADFFLLQRTSTDGSVTIYGDSYTTSSFAIVAGTTDYTLPMDLAELRRIDATTSGYESVVFRHADLATSTMRAYRAQTTNQDPTVIWFDVIGERTLTIAPKCSVALDLRLWYVPRTMIFSTAGASLMDFATDTDELALPHPLYLAVEEMATMRAQLMDRDPSATNWEQMAERTVRRFFGAHARQSQDPEVVEGVFE